ncbi:MAG: HAD family phosphatase [Sedimentisphaerales bacterium]|nr:HAD family phosphatase [Sedimentisphaerales bacterium]
MLRLVIFDFDGVIADSEKAHFETFRVTFLEEGIDISWMQYCQKYLGYTDRELIVEVLKDNQIEPSSENVDLMESIFQRKKAKFANYISQHSLIMDGVKDLMEDLRGNNIISAICSGALRVEIESILRHGVLEEYFVDIVAAEDVSRGKPDPEGYRLSLERVNRIFGSADPIKPGECVVIEDSHWGISAAHAAGMPCLALATSYPADQLQAAENVANDLTCVNVGLLREISSASSVGKNDK